MFSIISYRYLHYFFNIQFIKCMQTILFKTFLDKGHEYVDARVMMPSDIVVEGSIYEESLYEESLYEAIARSERRVRT